MGRKEQRAETRIFTLDHVRTYIDGRFTGQLTVGSDTAPPRNLNATFPLSIGRSENPVGEVRLAIRDDAIFDVRGKLDTATKAGKQYFQLLSVYPIWDVIAECDVLKKRVKGRTDARLSRLSLHATL